MSDDSEKRSAEHSGTPEREEEVGSGSDLHRGLKNRHVQMISWVPLHAPLSVMRSEVLIDHDHVVGLEASLALVFF